MGLDFNQGERGCEAALFFIHYSADLHWGAAFGAELACHFCTAFGTFLRPYGCQRCATFWAEFPGAFRATFRAFHLCLGFWSRCAAFGTELSCDGCAAFRTGNALGLSLLIIGVVGGLSTLAVPSVLHRAASHAA